MLIIDMEMPRNCGECPFVTPYSRCVFLGNYAIEENKRAENCPIKAELIRCQNCKYYCGDVTYTNHRICKVWNEDVFANGYCYYGERTDDRD